MSAQVLFHRMSRDRCTSMPKIWELVSSFKTVPRAIDAEVESFVALITISHRPSLTKYHQRLLRFTGVDGTWELSTIGTEAE